MTHRFRIAALMLSMATVLAGPGCSTKPKEPEEILSRRRVADSLMVQGYERTDQLLTDSALKLFDQALGIYSSLDERSGMISALLAMGRVQRIAGDPAGANELFLHAQGLAVYSGDPKEMRSVLNYRADLAIRSGNPVEAMELLSDREGDPDSGLERSSQLRLRGIASYELGKTEEAVVLLEQAAAVAAAADEAIEAAQAYYRLASIASLDARFADAEEWALKALESDKSREYSPGIAADLRALAIIKAKAGDLRAAEDYYRRSWLAWRGLGRPEEAESARLELEKITGREVSLP